ncbi:MAG: DUF2330 domain-containing protein [Deltaproteobacteria bacterium]|nr:MAG: DUF2330 domain-containing protein [Deltaproteobacteria bacterium]
MEKSILAAFLIFMTAKANAFCGFYVSKADTKLFNEASKVVMVRDGNRTVLTMANDYQGEAKEFATVVPVPTVLEKGQINVAEPALVDRIDAFTAPRLVEYHDPNPCEVMLYNEVAMQKSFGGAPGRAMKKGEGSRNYGVTIEAQYQVGEYDILILSAKESDGLGMWLADNGYKVPTNATKVLESYIKQGMKFFVAKVNLKEHSKLGYSYLRPLQMAYESEKFMLPIRLGMANAKDSQELFVFALTKTGRVETVNYRTVKIPSNMELPPYLKGAEHFKKFYKDMFSTAVRREDNKAVFLEYAWNMSWCDPCAADPLSTEELRKLGVFWVNDGIVPGQPGIPKPMPKRAFGGGAVEAYVTRLHVRYDNKNFPDDLRFQITKDTSNYQGRYVLRHPYKGEATCAEMDNYKKGLKDRQEKEITTLAHLTGWDRNQIEKDANFSSGPAKTDKKDDKWWNRIWN